VIEQWPVELAWKKFRGERIGSSEVCTLFGLNPFETPLELWARKTGKVQSKEGNDFMWLGTKMEPIIAQLFEKRTGKKVFPAQMCWTNDQYPDAIATPDYLILTGTAMDGVLECKNTSYRSIQYWSDEAPPRSALMQIIWQMGVGEREWGHVAGLVGGNPDEFFTPEVKFDKEVFTQMYEKAAVFCDLVRRDVPPDASGSDLKLLEKLYERKDETITLPDELLEVCEQYASFDKSYSEASKVAREYEEVRNNIKAKLIQVLGPASTGVVGKYLVNVKQINRAAHEVKAGSHLKFNLKTIEEKKDEK